MAIEVRKKTEESVEGMIRRFTKRVVQSGIVWRAKKRRFYTSPKSKIQVRNAALHRHITAARIGYLRKIGKFEETDDRRGRGRGRGKTTKNLVRAR